MLNRDPLTGVRGFESHPLRQLTHAVIEHGVPSDALSNRLQLIRVGDGPDVVNTPLTHLNAHHDCRRPIGVTNQQGGLAVHVRHRQVRACRRETRRNTNDEPRHVRTAPHGVEGRTEFPPVDTDLPGRNRPR